MDSRPVEPPHPYPIGVPGQPWGQAERDLWRARLVRQRSHADDVLTPARAIADLSAGPGEQGRQALELLTYGELVCGPPGAGSVTYPLVALRSRHWQPGAASVLVTGGVHGYETSGVQGALEFARQHAAQGHGPGHVNLLVVPCVSPWAYERIHRWNPDAVDPNRSFRIPSPAPEAAALIELVARVEREQGAAFTAHIDLHETTDTDESEFRPALAARDGVPFEPGHIPDGFYLVDDACNAQPAFQRAIIQAVEQVTHIAPADERGCIIGTPVADRGVIRYDFRGMGLCPSVSHARYTTTTEVYPDSPRTTPAQCIQAQVAAVRAAVTYAMRAAAAG